MHVIFASKCWCEGGKEKVDLKTHTTARGTWVKILNYTQLCQNNIFEGYDISLYQHTDKCHTLHISYLNEFCQV